MIVNLDYTFEQIAEITSAVGVKQNQETRFNQLLLDSRKLLYPELTIFIALQSPYRKGVDFIPELYEKGVRSFIVDEEINPSLYPLSNFLSVKSSLIALQALAIHHRKKFNFPVIGITGSNGKTIVKEWLNQLLDKEFNIVRSPRSFNSQIGVPLSILNMTGHDSLGIFEAGISEPGEMLNLEAMISPTIGILTNIGDAHDSGFTSHLQKFNEKCILFRNANLIICPHKLIDDLQHIFITGEGKRIVSWGRNKEATLYITGVLKSETTASISAEFSGLSVNITIPFTDEASIENAITCWCVLLQFSSPHIAEKMLLLEPVEMRLELKAGINQCSVINDSYNSDLLSLQVALDFLVQNKQSKLTVILSDILQSGRNNAELYHDVANLLLKNGITKVIGIGKEITSSQHHFSGIPERKFFADVSLFKSNFNAYDFSNETILLKGARVFEFEQISQLLEQKAHQTILSIDMAAIVHNLREYRKLLDPGVKVMAMVKAFSYGSGSYEIAGLLQFNKVDYLAVAYADEGIELRRSGINLPIVVMNPEESTFAAIVANNLEPEIFSFHMLHKFEKYLVSAGVDAFPVHIKLDTGMHRLGFDPKDVNILSEQLSNSKKVKVKSVFSHLVASEDPAMDDITARQADIFNKCCRLISQRLPYKFLAHLANSAGISRHSSLQLDMVRLGIGLYGIDGNPLMQHKLKNVSTLRTTIAQIKTGKKGDCIGYGGNNILARDTTIAIVRIGYADGYPRALSNQAGKMLIRNELMPVIGNISMDMTMLDITGFEAITEGDEVIVYGEQLPVMAVARWANTIPYEIISGISQRVKRVYFES